MEVFIILTNKYVLYNLYNKYIIIFSIHKVYFKSVLPEEKYNSHKMKYILVKQLFGTIFLPTRCPMQNLTILIANNLLTVKYENIKNSLKFSIKKINSNVPEVVRTAIFTIWRLTILIQQLFLTCCYWKFNWHLIKRSFPHEQSAFYKNNL